MTQKFDLIVIGTGTAGSVAAKQCRAAGWKVAIIDCRPFGGTCALRGCDPKKMLVSAEEVMDFAHRMTSNGIAYKDLHIDWSALMRFKRSFTDPIPEKNEKRFAEADIATFEGTARFVDQTTIQVGDETLVGRYILIATGAKPAPLHIPGEEYLTTSTQFLELEQLPQRIILVGGGYISMEFAHISARAGANVQILHRGSRPLEQFDPDLVDYLVQATRDIGIDVRLNTTVKAIEKAADRLIVHIATAQGEEILSADLVVHGAGRVPAIDDLDLDKAGVEREKLGISVNQYLQSVSNPMVYAAGDASASGSPPLTPVSSMEGHVVASNLLEGNYQTPDFTEIPSVVFTMPSLAAVGLQEKQAAQQGKKFRVNYQDTSSWYSSRRVNMKYSGYKVLIEEGSNQILGAHILGPHVEELVNIFAMAIRFGLRSEDLKKMIFAYPTAASDISYMV
ncbi:NAD(P)/FAD-dependent oxidoreductase [Chamaesiphon sp.]|uniref:dihydrolipoyl dehydrogenase family protein n=1 Tax=Chamaesiphon sp. TaxID=2814140 RepID=UPI0035934BBE